MIEPYDNINTAFLQMMDDDTDFDNFKKDIIEDIGKIRMMEQITGTIPALFCDYLDLCYHFVFIAEEVRNSKNDFIGELKPLFEESCRDLKVCMRNFDYLIANKFIDSLANILEKLGSWDNINIETIINLTFEKIAYYETPFKSWAENATACISKFYKVFRSIADNVSDEEDAELLEKFLYFAIIGHKIERHKILFAVNKKEE